MNEIQGILGDCRAFFSDLRRRAAITGIEIDGCEVSHVAFRTRTVGEYEDVREGLRPHCCGIVENSWNGRPVAKMLLAADLDLGDGFRGRLIELIPPPHREPFPFGLEHVGIVIGDSLERFRETHARVLSGRQDQGPFCQPLYITFGNGRTMKFYRHGLREVVELEGRSFGDTGRTSP